MKKIVAFGDSILKGVVLEPGLGLSYRVSENNFAGSCGERLGADVHNFGKFGCTITSGSAIVERNIAQIEGADIALLEWGGNDSDFRWKEVADDPDGDHHPFTTIDDFLATYKTIVAKITEAGSEPVILSLPPIVPGAYFDYITRDMSSDQKRNVLRFLGGNPEYIGRWHEIYNIGIFKLGKEINVPVIDITSTFLAQRFYADFICSDGIHPNAKGHQLIADALCKEFSKA